MRWNSRRSLITTVVVLFAAAAAFAIGAGRETSAELAAIALWLCLGASGLLIAWQLMHPRV